MSFPLISCIIPTFNSEKYLEHALESVFSQTYRPIQVIIADDHSVDCTPDVAGRYGDRICFVSEKRDSPAATRNLGVDRSDGEFLAFLDPDDLWHSEKLSRQMARFSKRPELEISVTNARMFWDADIKDEERFYQDLPRSRAVPGYATTTLLVRRAVFSKIGMFNTDYFFGDSMDWFIRAREKGVVMELMEDVLTFHRMHDANLTRRRKQDSKEEFLKIIKDRLDKVRRQE